MKVVHYLNQFFAGLGGEESALQPPYRVDGALGPGRGLGLDIAYTLVCGDSYFAEHEEEALRELLGYLDSEPPDLLVCGPVFGSGRYGYACGTIGKHAAALGIRTVTAMDAENPGVEAAGGSVTMIKTGTSVVQMRHVLPQLARVGQCLVSDADLSELTDVEFLRSRVGRNAVAPVGAAGRAISMLLEKMAGRTRTEISSDVNQGPPAAPVRGMSAATIAIITESGCVPAGNPDRVPSHGAKSWHRYPVAGLTGMSQADYEVVHAGFDTSFGMADPNRLVPLDALRLIEAQGRFLKLHDWMYVTVGNNTSVSMAAMMGKEIATELKNAEVTAAILTAT